MDARRPAVRAFQVPADEGEPCQVLEVRTTAAALSDAIGGGMLDEVRYDRSGTRAFIVYLDEDRAGKGLPENARAQTLAVGLGWPDRHRPVQWSGDVLIVGVGDHDEDLDVPPRVLDAARWCGLLPSDAPSDAPPDAPPDAPRDTPRDAPPG